MDHPLDINIIGSKWIFTIKYHYDGKVEHNKTMLVEKGYTRSMVSIFREFSSNCKVGHHSPSVINGNIFWMEHVTLKC